MFTLEGFDEKRSARVWRELPQCYGTAEQALEAAGQLWEDDGHHFTQIRLKRTVTFCTLIRPEREAVEE